MSEEQPLSRRERIRQAEQEADRFGRIAIGIWDRQAVLRNKPAETGTFAALLGIEANLERMALLLETLVERSS